MKKKITAIISSAILAFSLMPFSIIKAATNVTEYSSGTFDQGVWTTYYGVNSNAYVVLNEFGLIQNVSQFESVTVTKIDLNDYYDGDIDITCYGNITTNLWEFYVQGEGAYITGSTSTHIYIHVVNCQQFYLVGLCGNDTDIYLRPKSIATGLTKAQGTSVVINPNYIQKFRFWINADDGNNPPWSNIAYTTNSLNSFSYFNTSLSNYSVRRLDAHFNYEITNGNFFVCTFYLKSSTSVEKWGTGMVGIRDFTGVNRDYSGQVYRYYYKTPAASGSYVYLCTIYIPIGILSKAGNGYDYNIQLNSGIGYLTNTTACGWIYRGTVDSIPDYVMNQSYVSNPSTDIENTADELTDLHDQENQIVSDFHDNLTDFNTNMDLTGYDFITGLNNSNNYFKMLLDQMYVDSSSIRAFWVIPLILVILTVLLGR